MTAEVICPLVYAVGVVATTAMLLMLDIWWRDPLAAILNAALWPLCFVMFPVFHLLHWLWDKTFGDR